MKKKRKWTIKDTVNLYQIDRWGDGYFSVNKKGHLAVRPQKRKKGTVIDILDIIEEIKTEKLSLPVVVRFHDILRDQVANLNRTFRSVIKKAGYNGKYIGVYPVKVNQMREVVEEIVDVGARYDYGLEAGSKPELLSALAYNTNKEALTILNGFKDKDYLTLGLLGRKLGRKIIIVIEKFSELKETLDLAERMNVKPLIGLRVKLSTKGSGKWAESGGDRAKFGLTVSEIIQAINVLKEESKEDCLKLLHFHIGSQITDIRIIKDAITEGARIYTQIVKMGIPLEYIDVGGGLGVDYDGSKSTADSSVNYSLKDYIEDIVYIVQQICDLEGIEHPNIVSESGRAVTAKHSCVIFKVFDFIKVAQTKFDLGLEDVNGDQHILVENARELWDELSSRNFQETYNDAMQIKSECINAFKLGVLSLEERAIIETYFWKIMEKINNLVKNLEFVPEELMELEENLSLQYLSNCSFFQSAPDSWAIGQVFPIIPLVRLDEEPTVLSTLSDITCDSDGKIDKFIDSGHLKTNLPLHDLKKNEDYYVGIFMVGAYQDVIGDWHNLFGKLTEVHIFSDNDDSTGFYIEEIIHGDTSAEVLKGMQYNTESMASDIKRLLNREVQKLRILPKEAVKLAEFYQNCLKDYTYLKK